MADTTLSFNVLAKDNATRTIARVGQSFGDLHMSVGKVMKGLVAVGPALAGLAIGAGIKDFIGEARESAKVGRVTEAVIKSTGGAARITADQVGALATAISNKTGADDEAVQSGENLLLTFTNIRNGVGKGNQIFDQATQAVTDMTAALNDGQVTTEGVKASSIQLGKALNDPIKGVTALQKVGVSFTADQKKQIKTLVDSGKTMQAQKIILGELNKEFGGAAAAASDPLQKLGVIVGNAKEAIGGAFLPVVDKAATILGRVVPAAISKAAAGFAALGAAFKTGQEPGSGFIGVMQRIGITSRFVFEWFKASALPILKEFAGFIAGTILPKLGEFAGFVKNQFVTNVIPAVQNLVTVFKPLVVEVGTNLVGAFKKIAPPVIGLGKTIAKDVGPALKSFTGFLKDNGTVVRSVAVGVGAIIGAILLYKATLGVVSGVTKAYTAVQAALNVVMALNPIAIVVLALVGLAAGLVYAYKKSETFRNIVNGVFGAVRDFAVGAFKKVTGAIASVVTFFKNLPGNVARALGDTGRTLAQAGKNLIGGLINGVVAYVKLIGGVGAWMYHNVIVPAVSPFAKAGEWLHQAGKNVLAGFWNGLKEIWADVTKWVSGIATWIKDHKGPVSLDGRLLIPAGRAIMNGFLKGLKSGAGPAWDFVKSVGGKTVEMLRNVDNAISTPLASGMAKLVQGIAANYGWGSGAEWNALSSLIMGESGFRPNAQNPTSSAYGMFQFLDSTWGTVGGAKTSDPTQQTILGLRYIQKNYGDPVNAYSKWSSRSPHWYEQGTPWVPNDQLAYLHRGEAVIPADVNRQRIQSSSGSTQQIVLEIRSGGSRQDDFIAETIRRYVRVNGGDVQAVLGR